MRLMRHHYWRLIWMLSKILLAFSTVLTVICILTGSLNNEATRNKRAVDHRPITVVTAYYIFKSKHPHKQYLEWMKNFLQHIPCHLVIFTDILLEPLMTTLRRSYRATTRIHPKNFSEFEMAKKMTFWSRQKLVDPEQKQHSENLYIIWNEKIKLVMDAIHRNDFDSDYFVWCDIGSFRSAKNLHELKSFPNEDKVSRLDHHKLYFLQTDQFNTTDFEIRPDGLPVHNFQLENRLGGTVIVGHKTAWKKWENVYYDILDRLAAAGRFVGKDQNVMASLAVMYPDTVELIQSQPFFGGSGNPWFFMHYNFS